MEIKGYAYLEILLIQRPSTVEFSQLDFEVNVAFEDSLFGAHANRGTKDLASGLQL